MISSTRAGPTVDLPPELWAAIVQLAASSLADLARLSALSAGIRCLAWSSPASRIRFLKSTARNENQAMESLFLQLEDVHDLRLFPDLADLLSLLRRVGPVACGVGWHGRDDCLALRVCDVVDDDAWVSACLKVLSGKVMTHHLGPAFRKPVNQGLVHLVPALFDGHDGDPRDVVVAKSCLYPEKNWSYPVDIKLIATAAPDPVLVFTLLLRHWGFIAQPRPTGFAVLDAATGGRRDVASFLAEVMGLRLDGPKAREVAGCIWEEVTYRKLVDVDLVEFLINLGAKPTSWDFMDSMNNRHSVLPERIEDDPLLLLMSTTATFGPTSYTFDCAAKLIRREHLFRQLVDLNILDKSYIDICLDACCDLDDETIAVAEGNGNLEFLQMITPHMENGMEKDYQVVNCISGPADVFDSGCCEFVLDLGFPVTANSIALLVSAGSLIDNDGDALRVLAAMLKTAERDKATIIADQALMHPYVSAFDAAMSSRCETCADQRGEMKRVFPQVKILLEFGFPATRDDYDTASHRGYLVTAELIKFVPNVRDSFSD
ncbi:hypothetical protein HK101_002803 [Irineochytrium annulatum]|nr:hypothetical protein HK101_002803 [Irineochytrium annulatum]